MSDKPEIVQIKMDKPMKSEVQAPTAALRIKIDQNKNIVVYNRINSYILDTLMKAVFNNAH